MEEPPPPEPEKKAPPPLPMEDKRPETAPEVSSPPPVLEGRPETAPVPRRSSSDTEEVHVAMMITTKKEWKEIQKSGGSPLQMIAEREAQRSGQSSRGERGESLLGGRQPSLTSDTPMLGGPGSEAVAA